MPSASSKPPTARSTDVRNAMFEPSPNSPMAYKE